MEEVLEDRQQEIQDHLAQHQLNRNHNLNRKDDDGSEYPTIDQKPQINDHKITKTLFVVTMYLK